MTVSRGWGKGTLQDVGQCRSEDERSAIGSSLDMLNQEGPKAAHAELSRQKRSTLSCTQSLPFRRVSDVTDLGDISTWKSC